MTLYELLTNDSAATLVAAVFTFAGTIVTWISAMWVGNRRRGGNQGASHRAYVQNLQAEKTRLINDLTSCMERGERQSETIARINAEHEATKRDLEKAMKQIEFLFKVVYRLDPTLKDTFGSDFIPL